MGKIEEILKNPGNYTFESQIAVDERPTPKPQSQTLQCTLSQLPAQAAATPPDQPQDDKPIITTETQRILMRITLELVCYIKGKKVSGRLTYGNDTDEKIIALKDILQGIAKCRAFDDKKTKTNILK